MYFKIDKNHMTAINKYPLTYKDYNHCVSGLVNKCKDENKQIKCIYDKCKKHINNHIDAKIIQASSYCKDKDNGTMKVDANIKKRYCDYVKELEKLKKNISKPITLDEYNKYSILKQQFKKGDAENNKKRDVKYLLMY